MVAAISCLASEPSLWKKVEYSCSFCLSFLFGSLFFSLRHGPTSSPPLRSFPTTWNRSGTQNDLTYMQEFSISGSGASVVGWTLSWTTDCRSVLMAHCSSAVRLHQESFGAPCWRRPMPSEWQWKMLDDVLWGLVSVFLTVLGLPNFLCLALLLMAVPLSQDALYSSL